MRLCVSVLAVVPCLFVSTGVSWSGGDEEKVARAILDKAIQAHGGEANLGKIKAVYLKGTGVIRAAGDLKFSAEWYVMGTTHSKLTVDADVNGMIIRIIKVMNGDKGWQKLGDAATMPLNADDLAEEKATIYAHHVTTLLPLKEKGVTLSSLGELKVGDQTLVGLRATRDKHADVSLYFDKKTNLVVKVETSIKDQGGRDIVQEANYSDYKAVDGVQCAHKIEFKRDGKAFVDGEFSEVRLHAQKLDLSIFDMP
jgi:hypothetical protein